MREYPAQRVIRFEPIDPLADNSSGRNGGPVRSMAIVADDNLILSAQRFSDGRKLIGGK